jgi:hypothetical protein
VGIYQKEKYTGEYYKASWDENGKFIREGRFGKVPPR